MARGKFKKRKPPPPAPELRLDEPASERLARLREELRPQLESLEAESRRYRAQLVPLVGEPARPSYAQRLRRAWRAALDRLAMRLAFRRMRARMLAPPDRRAIERTRATLARFERHLRATEKKVAQGMPRFLADAEMFLDDLRHEVEQARIAADRWEDWARQAVLGERDDLARDALQLRDAWHHQADAWQKRLEEVRKSVEAL